MALDNNTAIMIPTVATYLAGYGLWTCLADGFRPTFVRERGQRAAACTAPFSPDILYTAQYTTD